MSIYRLDNGLLGQSVGLGKMTNDDSLCLILNIELAGDGNKYAHIIRLKHAERLAIDEITHFAMTEDEYQKNVAGRILSANGVVSCTGCQPMQSTENGGKE